MDQTKTNNPYKDNSKPLELTSKPSSPIQEEAMGITLGNINVSASIEEFAPELLASSGFGFSGDNIIPSTIISGSYSPQDPNSSIEFFIYDYNKRIIITDHEYKGWEVTNNPIPPDIPTTFTNDQGLEQKEISTGSLPTSLLQLNPVQDISKYGVDSGTTYALYNFLTNELGSNYQTTFYISEISSDRTEVRLKSNFIANADIRKGYKSLVSKLNSSKYFDEFYLNLYTNDYATGINCYLDDNEEKGLSVLVKLLRPLQQFMSVGDECFVVTKQSETLSWQVNFTEDFSSLIDDANYIKGPNINISLQDLVNNSTPLKSKSDLLNSPSSQSLDSVLNVLNQTGITITPNYSYNTFNEFINFSSAKARINNFYEKVSQIQSYQADIDTLTSTTGSNPNVSAISQSLASLQTNITNLVENFDGYENYLYYNNSQFAYPKTGSSYPYTLLPTGSTTVLEWMGSDSPNSQYYGGYVLSASLYDENNQNWLYYTIPTFITENDNNENYITFSNMVGQSFDEIWLYTKALSERYNTTNNPDTGLPLGLAAEAIKGLGFETFGNNYDNQDNFIGLTGEDNGVYVPPTGSELITNYIAINNGQIVNYWDLGYSWLHYVQQVTEPGFPYAIDKVSKEIYKRLYHNMAYLTKKKGTISGLRQLINIWGIPNTILRINEFGGKNRDNTDDYDLWYKRYSYAYTPVANAYAASSSVKVPWMPLERNYIADSNQYIVPDGVALRFKTIGHPSSSYGGSYYSQSIAVKKSNGTADNKFDWGIGLFYEDQPSGSYSGSSFSDYYDYGKLRFYLSGSAADGGVAISDDIELPFFDGGWWTVLLQRDQHVSASNNNQGTTYTLYAGNKLDNGWDGNSIGWTGSVSMSTQAVTSFIGYDGGFYEEAIYDNTSAASSSVNASWNSFGTTEHDGVYVGGYVSGSNVGVEVLNEGAKIFSGSLQEFRYYSNNIAQTVFNDFVMNPESIEGNNVTGSESSFDIVNFRAPLGNELEYFFTASNSGSYVENISSSHPAITGSAPQVITASFINPLNSSVTSSYEFIHYSSSTTRTYSKTNVETYFLDQPSIGVRNRVSNKIQVEDGEKYGNVLSKYRSIQQNYLISESYTEDISSLEVGFSPQDEVNDDIIATYGYGVISDTLADPRFAFSGSQTYYPQLRKTAEDYFKKYTEGNVWDYLRLIKYFDNSIFKAIKSYVPARTSVTTGVIIKQHMLERNRRVPVTVDPNTVIAYTPETGSVVGGQSTATGNNSPISYRNLMITGSLNVGSITGSNGGTPPELHGNVSSSGAGMNIVPITQSWTGSNKTISGSITYVDKTQTEFFNGEFSGSEFIATTQSLLNNPFAPSQTLNTSYNIGVTASLGKYSNTNFQTWDQEISSYPSFSIYLETKVFDAQTYSGYTDLINEEIVGWYATASLVNTGKNAALVALVQSQNNPENFFIYNFSLSLEGLYIDKGGPKGNLSKTWSNSLLGFSPKGDIRTPYNFPLPPTESGNMTGIINGTYSTNNIGPYFKFDVSQSYGGPRAQFFQIGNPGSCEFEVSGLLGNLASNIICSPILGNKDYITISNPTENGQYFVSYQWTNPELSGQRPLRIVQNGGGFIPQSQFATTFNTSSIDPTKANPGGSVGGQVVTCSLMLSNYIVDASQNTYHFYSQSYGTIGGWINGYESDGLGPGTGSLILVGTTWTGSFGDSGYYAPVASAFSRYNYDDEVLINNTNTLANFPDFDFDITNFSGSAATKDSYGLSGSLFVQKLANPNTLFSIANSDRNKSLLGYNYNVLANRQLSGSQFELSLPGQYIPSGSQGLQYINFNPQLPPFEDFYNTPFNALINNVTQSVPNTYLQQVEYEGGSSTGSSGVPSNIIPIINNTAPKARVPDSFYTQKSSITPRYLGSKLQSADYNTYTPLGSQITYLNGKLSGSIISGSNQSVVGNCFIAGTQITIANSNYTIYGVWTTKNIEDIEVGEAIVTYNENTQELEPGLVGDLQIREVESIIRLTFDNGNVINTTSEHPFYVEGKNWVTANNLVVGDVCKTISNTSSTLSSIETINETTTVYNLLSVAPNHNFYANNILVHNKSTPTSITSSVWGGDSNRGTMRSVKTSVGTVNKHPIYFAHFKNAKENYELWDSYTFRIDQLILCPLEDITENAPESPVTIKIDGSNNNLTDVRSTFEVDREALVAYNQSSTVKSGSLQTINYTSLKVGSNKIYQGGLEYNNIFTTQDSKTTFPLTQSFLTASWNIGLRGVGGSYTPYNHAVLGLGASFATGPSVGYDYNAVVDSDANGGFLRLRGGGIMITSSADITGGLGATFQWAAGPSLGLIHSMNKRVSLGLRAANFSVVNIQAGRLGIPIGAEPFDINDPTNYWRFSPSSSEASNNANTSTPTAYGMGAYEDFGIPFVIEENDEIRLTWNSSQGDTPLYESADFVVTSVPSASSNSSDYIVPGLLLPASLNSASIYDKIYLSPDPNNFNIPTYGNPAVKQINRFEIRRRINADDRVIIYQTPPTGSLGVKTLTPSGYLIPDDFTPQQKRNVQSIINNLNAKNVFRADEDNDNKRTPVD